MNRNEIEERATQNLKKKFVDNIIVMLIMVGMMYALNMLMRFMFKGLTTSFLMKLLEIAIPIVIPSFFAFGFLSFYLKVARDEEVTFKEVTTGAHDDFKKATKTARRMVTEFGMSKLGPMMFEEPEGSTFLGRDYSKSKNFSDKVANEIDEEVRSIINDCYKKTTDIITKNKDLPLFFFAEYMKP